MNERSTRILTLFCLTAALLAGCSSSSSPDDGAPDDSTGAQADDQLNTPAETPPAETPPAETPPAETPPAETPPAETPPAETPPAETPPAETPGETTTENPAETDMLIPLVAQGSDLERLTRGIKRQAALTLLDLNQRLTGGVTLTDQQETCVGSYDPALGEKLLAIDCLQPLATGNTPIYTSKVAFYDSENCHISISLGNTVNCQLAYAALSLPTEWTKPANGPPAPVYPGSEIHYAIDDTMLHIENAPSALTGLFKCDIDLTSGTAQTPLTGQSCPAIITSVADRIDTLLPAE